MTEGSKSFYSGQVESVPVFAANRKTGLPGVQRRSRSIVRDLESQRLGKKKEKKAPITKLKPVDQLTQVVTSIPLKGVTLKEYLESLIQAGGDVPDLRDRAVEHELTGTFEEGEDGHLTLTELVPDRENGPVFIKLKDKKPHAA